MYKVYETDGTLHCIVYEVETAITICKSHAGWYWEQT